MRSEEFDQGRGYQTFDLGAHKWDVEKALAHVAGKKPNDTLDVENAASLLGIVRINREHAATTDLSKPVIGVQPGSGHFKGYVVPIDGWHRIYRAHQEGVKELPMHLIGPTNEKKIRIR